MAQVNRRQVISGASVAAAATLISHAASQDADAAQQPHSEGKPLAISEACRVKIINSAPGQVIRYGGATFRYNSGGPSHDPDNLPTNGLKPLHIPHNSVGYLFGKPNRCCKTITVILTWTNGSGSVDFPDAGSGYCWLYPEVELAPAFRSLAEDGPESSLELLVTDPETGQKKRYPVKLSEEASRIVQATEDVLGPV